MKGDPIAVSESYLAHCAKHGITPVLIETTDTLTTVDDVTPEVLDMCGEVFDGWFYDAPSIDWQDFLDRLEKFGWSVVDLDGPAFKKVQRHVRQLRKERQT